MRGNQGTRGEIYIGAAGKASDADAQAALGLRIAEPHRTQHIRGFYFG